MLGFRLKGPVQSSGRGWPFQRTAQNMINCKEKQPQSSKDIPSFLEITQKGTKMDPFSSRHCVFPCVCMGYYGRGFSTFWWTWSFSAACHAMAGFTHYSHCYCMSVIARTACYRNLVIMTCCEQPHTLSHTPRRSVSLPSAFLSWPLWSNLCSYVLDCCPRCLTPAFEISPLM